MEGQGQDAGVEGVFCNRDTLACCAVIFVNLEDVGGTI